MNSETLPVNDRKMHGGHQFPHHAPAFRTLQRGGPGRRGGGIDRDAGDADAGGVLQKDRRSVCSNLIKMALT